MRTIAGIFVVLAVSAAGAEEPQDAGPVFDARVRLLFLQVSGRVEAGESKTMTPTHGEISHVREDLGLRGGPFVDALASLYITRDIRVSGRVLYGEVRNDLGVDRKFEFNGETFHPGEDLLVEISHGSYGVEGDMRFQLSDDVDLWAGIGVALHTQNVHLKVRESAGSHIDLDNGERIKAIIPYAHLGLTADLGRGFFLRGDLRGSAFSFGGLIGEPGEGRFIAAEVGFGWRPVDWLAVELGFDAQWHYLKFEGVALDDTPDINRFRLLFLGPSLTVSIRF